MTSYHGGKQRIGKKLAEVIHDKSLDIEDKFDFTIKGYCEPFCGMLGVYQHIPQLFIEHKPKLKYVAGDINKSVILMWKEAKGRWKPPIKVLKKEYDKLRYDGKSSALKGYIGHQYSFGGQYLHGYFKAKNSYPKTVQKVKDIAVSLRHVKFQDCNYNKFSNLKNYIIYCDPPYSSFSIYYNDQNKRVEFDPEEFWDWCREMSKNNIVIISEYKAPIDFKKIFTSKNSSVIKGKQSSKTDNLFIHKSWI